MANHYRFYLATQVEVINIEAEDDQDARRQILDMIEQSGEKKTLVMGFSQPLNFKNDDFAEAYYVTEVGSDVYEGWYSVQGNHSYANNRPQFAKYL